MIYCEVIRTIHQAAKIVAWSSSLNWVARNEQQSVFFTTTHNTLTHKGRYIFHWATAFRWVYKSGLLFLTWWLPENVPLMPRSLAASTCSFLRRRRTDRETRRSRWGKCKRRTTMRNLRRFLRCHCFGFRCPLWLGWEKEKYEYKQRGKGEGERGREVKSRLVSRKRILTKRFRRWFRSFLQQSV